MYIYIPFLLFILFEGLDKQVQAVLKPLKQ